MRVAPLATALLMTMAATAFAKDPTLPLSIQNYGLALSSRVEGAILSGRN